MKVEKRLDYLQPEEDAFTGMQFCQMYVGEDRGSLLMGEAVVSAVAFHVQESSTTTYA